MDKIRWGVLSCAGIAQKAMFSGIMHARNATLYAISSRSQDKLEAVAARFPCEKQYIGYDAVLRDPDVDAVYIPLPNALHCEWVVRALEAGKPVLCEKPLAMNAGEVRRIMAASERTGVPVMEAFAYLHDPMMARIRELVASGALGRLRYIEANFSYLLKDTSNVRLIRPLGGGATYDLGCYPVSFIRELAGTEPAHIHTMGRLGDVTRVDEDVLVQMEFASGLHAVSYCSFQAHWSTYNLVLGEYGSIEFPTIFDRGERKTITVSIAGQERRVEEFETGRRYSLQVEQMGRVIAEGEKPAISLDFSLGNAAAMDEILRTCGY